MTAPSLVYIYLLPYCPLPLPWMMLLINGPLVAVAAAHKLPNAILAKIRPLPLRYAKKASLHAIFTIVEHKG